MRRLILVLLFGFVALGAFPAGAQRENLRIGETLGVRVQTCAQEITELRAELARLQGGLR